jgi:hypothetical protein
MKKKLTFTMLIALICLTSCSYVALIPTRVLIDSIDTEPVYWPGLGYPNVMVTDTLNTYYTTLKVKGKLKYLQFLEKPGKKQAGDSATIVQKKRKIYIIK